MKIITEPSVYLIGKQVVDDAELGRFLDAHDVGHWETDTEVGAEKLVEVAGRVCYMSFAKPRPGGNEAYIGHILEVGHGSVLEHAVFSLLITGVSRSLTHEFIRHRAGFAYSELSQRFYVPEEPAFVMPPLALEDPSIAEFMERGFEGTYGEYRALVTIGIKHESEKWQAANPHDKATVKDLTLIRKRARESARSVLPNCTETKIFVTGNARAWRHFIEMRGSEHADAEIRRLARAVHAKLAEASPNLFGDYVAKTNSIETEFRKV